MNEPQENGDGDGISETTDVSEAIRTKRVKSIIEARGEARRIFNKTTEQESVGEISSKHRMVMVAQAVDSYITELEYLLQNSEVGQEYWLNRPVGTWEIEPPKPRVLAHRYKEKTGKGTSPADKESSMPTEYELVNTEDFETWEIQIVGLKEFLDVNKKQSIPFTASFRIRFDRDNPHTVTEKITKTMPQHISKTAYRLANDFCGRLDLDIELQEEKPPAQI